MAYLIEYKPMAKRQLLLVLITRIGARRDIYD
jgi:hypothetical protein